MHRLTDHDRHFARDDGGHRSAGVAGSDGERWGLAACDVTTGEIRRFLTGPNGCEITGIAFTPDNKTMFINIQHPGEPADERNDPAKLTAISTWPDGPKAGRPRSATVVVRKLDGGVIGS